MHTHTHTHTHVYKHIDVQIHTHMHIYTYIHVCTHTHIHIYTHTHTKLYMNARKHAWNDGAAANVQGAVADQGSFALLFRSTQSNHILHLQCKDFIVPTSRSTNTPPAVQQSRSTRARKNPSPRMIKVTVHEKRRVNEEQPTLQAAHHANHDSAAPRQHLLICTGAEPIHQVNPCRELRSRCSEIGSHFHHFPAVFIT